MFEHSMLELGESVLALKPKKSNVIHRNKLDSRWFEGIFLGFRGLSNEFFVGTPEGVKRVRTVKRKARETRWSIDALNSFRGLPWQLQATKRELVTDVIAFGPAVKPMPIAARIPDPISNGGGDIYSRF